MSERLAAPARSPLRRQLLGKESPIKGKHSKSPIRKTDGVGRTKQKPTETEAELHELVYEQAADIDHDIAHLSPALQRFWQVNTFLQTAIHRVY